MPPSSELLFEIKSRQNVLIVRAGLSVPSQEMSAKQITVSMMTQYLFQVGNYRHNLGCPPNAFLRSSRHCDASVTDSELHNGSTLWRKFGAIKKYVNNSITPIYVKLLGPDGKPPSGLTTADILHRTRKILYDKEQDEAKARSRNQGTFTKKPFSSTWFPVEWEVFLLFGRASDASERAFFIEQAFIRSHTSILQHVNVISCIHFAEDQVIHRMLPPHQLLLVPHDLKLANNRGLVRGQLKTRRSKWI